MPTRSITYIYCPANVVTGGTELLHQLAASLTSKQISTLLVYVENGNIINAKIPSAFEIYNVQVTENVTDDFNARIILPEVYLYLGKKFQNAAIYCWWLSVDNFFHDGLGSVSDAIHWNTWFGFKRFIKKYLFQKKFPKSISLDNLKEKNYFHLYQSYYAKQFLASNGIIKSFSLGDYINLDYLNESNSDKKENIILYNPRKVDKNFLKLLVECADYKWVPLENMNRKELADQYRKAKLYIDFGPHPGKDRIPREAAINNCCIITNRIGSAQYEQDIPIPSQYKLGSDQMKPHVIRKKIENIFEYYTDRVTDFEYYRSVIKKEKEQFDNEVNNIFNQN